MMVVFITIIVTFSCMKHGKLLRECIKKDKNFILLFRQPFVSTHFKGIFLKKKRKRINSLKLKTEM